MSAQPTTSVTPAGPIAGLAGAFALTPIMQFSSSFQPSPPIIPGNIPAPYTYAGDTLGAPVVYPFEEMGIERSFAKLTDQDIPELARSNRNDWTVTIAVPVPAELINPTIKELVYVVKYATTHDNGNAVVQTDTLLTDSNCKVGLVTRGAEVNVYHTRSGYAPRLINGKAALCLSSTPAIKCNGGGVQWSHYLDHRWLTPNIRLTQNTNLYLNFHVYEYPTERTARTLSIEVSAKWLDDLEERRRREEEAKSKVREEAERVTQEATAKQSPNEKLMADRSLIQKIKAAMAKLPPARHCPNVYEWTLDEAGGRYVCNGGEHFISFEEILEEV